ncbi:hypothetical protein K0B96_10705 [Horticoccus luteus]|uniref:Uncharacterized protein n=1 Tax=Horticoccus luteus TaxID=2862869 RepID=A0A8F9TRS0_9BACT|nr:hypothetical protein [Horticoccus luteus]QYM77791.1 hypothetical protein K0B96_10705 [Horticoccus luteus]
MRFHTPLILAVACLGCFAACREAKVKHYRVAHEEEPAMPAANADGANGAATGSDMANTAVPTAEGPALSWTAPADWTAKTLSAMRKGSFTVPGPGGDADLSVTAFPGDVGGDLANVNRWRGQVQLPPLAAGDLEATLKRFSANGLDFAVVDLAPQDEKSAHLIGAIVPLNGATWFFKLMGPSATVSAQRDAFLKFLHTVKVGDGEAAPAARAPAASPAAMGNDMATTAVPTADGAALAWAAPAAWHEKTLSAMRKGSYAVPGAGGEADLAITAFPGDVGGDLANVNRWRGQVQLPPLTAGELEATLKRFSANGLNFAVVELAPPAGSQAPRLIGAIVPHGGATWFFKLMGPDATVAAQRDAFLAFLHTVKIR